MRLYNLYGACRTLGIEKRSNEVFAYISLLGTPGSYCYDPMAQTLISDMLSAVFYGRDTSILLYQRLFFGQFESLLAQSYSMIIDPDMVSRFSIPQSEVNRGKYKMDRLKFQETVNNLLRNRNDNINYKFFDDHHPEINVLSYYALWYIKSATTHYAAEEQDHTRTLENLKKKAEYLKRAKGADTIEYIMTSTIVLSLDEAIQSPKTNSEMFALLIENATSKVSLLPIQKEALRVMRNNAVHDDRIENPNYHAIAGALLLLLGADPQSALSAAQIERQNKRIRLEKIPYRILAVVHALIWLTILLYFVGLGFSLSFDNTKTQQIQLDNVNSSEFNAKWNEAMGTKNVQLLLEMQNNIRTANEIIREAEEKTPNY